MRRCLRERACLRRGSPRSPAATSAGPRSSQPSLPRLRQLGSRGLVVRTWSSSCCIYGAGESSFVHLAPYRSTAVTTGEYGKAARRSHRVKRLRSAHLRSAEHVEECFGGNQI